MVNLFEFKVEQRFREAEGILHDKCKGVAELKDVCIYFSDAFPTLLTPPFKQPQELQQHYLNQLLASSNLVVSRNSNPISLWHGASTKKLESICWYGLLNLSSTDPGYFGKAMYFTQHPKYGEYYAEVVKEKSAGSFGLILCWGLLGRPFPVTQVRKYLRVNISW